MKIVKILGGLGNQMFQYALLVALRETFREEVLMDPSVFDTYKLHNGFELDRVFKITARRAIADEIRCVTRFTRQYQLSRIYRRLLPPKRSDKREARWCRFDPTVLTDNRDLYYDGIWQNYLYFDQFKEAVLKEFTFREEPNERNEKALEVFAQGGTTVSLHIRRGDYLKHKNYRGLCGPEYYAAAVKYSLEQCGKDVRFAVFSNDMPWCQEHIVPLFGECRHTLVDWNTGKDSYNDMRLMSACRMNIIANSSFSWWAAYMNAHPDKVIIAPKVWTNMPVEFDRQMPDWVLF